MRPVIDLSGPGYINFRNHLGMIESSNDYANVSSAGYLGRFQFSEVLLKDLGYYMGDDTKYTNDWKGIWTGKSGICSKEDFLQYPLAQDEAFGQGMQYYWRTRIQDKGLDSYVGKKINGIIITREGLLGASWLMPGGLAQFLHSKGKKDPKDGLGISISRRLAMFNNDHVEFISYPSKLNLAGYECTSDTPLSCAQNECTGAQEVRRSVPKRDPLILDLNRDGIKTVNVNSGAFFDFDGNGFAEKTGWADPNDGLLVLDRNGDGIINDGKELFGDQTILANGQRATDGFHALAELDGNGDGQIDTNDAAYTQLRVWRDEEGDGCSLPGELHTLQELGIASINVTGQATNVTDENGNILNFLGSFQWSDGTNGQIGSYSLQRDTLHTVATEWLEVPEETAALPYLQGSGNVYDIDQAMVRDTSGALKGLVEQFIASTDVSARNSLMDQILFKWTGSDGLDPANRGGNFDARKLAVLEKFRRTHLIKWNLAQVRGGGWEPTAGILPYFEDWLPTADEEIGPKDFLSRVRGWDFISQYGSNPIARAVP